MPTRLTSSELAWAPGIIKYAIKMYLTASTPDEVKTAVNIFSSWKHLSVEEMLSIIDGNYVVQGANVVVISDDDPKES